MEAARALDASVPLGDNVQPIMTRLTIEANELSARAIARAHIRDTAPLSGLAPNYNWTIIRLHSRVRARALQLLRRPPPRRALSGASGLGIRWWLWWWWRWWPDAKLHKPVLEESLVEGELGGSVKAGRVRGRERSSGADGVIY